MNSYSNGSSSAANSTAESPTVPRSTGSIRVCCFGDIIGRCGMDSLRQALRRVHRELNPDLVIVNGENAESGRGLSRGCYEEFWAMGCGAITTGNHWKDHPDIHELAQLDHPPVVLPGNMENISSLDSALRYVSIKGSDDENKDHTIAVINLAGRLFMPPASCPFRALDHLLGSIPSDIKLRIVDLHTESTSEKQAMGYYGASRVGLVYGSHTHVPTDDLRILEGFTGYLSDVGMTGAEDSVIGMNPHRYAQRFMSRRRELLAPAEGDGVVWGLWADLDTDDGSCRALGRFGYRVTDPHKKLGEASISSLLHSRIMFNHRQGQAPVYG